MKYKFCQKCRALNRIAPSQDSTKRPVCGKCGEKLNSLSVVETLSEELADKLIRNSDRPVLVDVFAHWCGPCQSYGPIFSEVGEKLYKKADFIKLDADQSPGFCGRYGIRGVPATLVFKNGKLVNQLSGVQSRQQLESYVGAL